LLLAAFALVACFLVAEVAAAVASSSLALLADAGHMLTDALALLMAVAAARLASRPVTPRWTFGLGRVEVVSAAVNGVTLLVVAALVTAEAVRRLVHPVAVAGTPLIAVAAVGLLVTLAATMLLSRADRRSINIAGAFAHVATDALAFAATVVAGIVVLASGVRRADPVASLVVVVLMLRASTGLLRDAGRVLLDAAPAGVDVDDLRRHLLSAGHVVDVHDLHIWTAGSRLPTVSAHVVVEDGCFGDGHAPGILDELQSCLAGHFDVEHSTFQLEPAGHGAHELGAH
jgi:cobalt-zinc-cadmium efflux system protein